MKTWVLSLCLVFLGVAAKAQKNPGVFTSLEEAFLHPTEVVELKLTWDRLTEWPDSLDQFPNLRTLDLSHNKIRRLPANLTYLIALETLDLTGNNIDTIGASIGDLHNLRVLRLGNNEIWTLDPAVGVLSNLELLEVWSNNLTKLPKELGTLPALKEIDLRGIQFNETQQERIKAMFRSDVRIQLSSSCNCR